MHGLKQVPRGPPPLEYRVKSAGQPYSSSAAAGGSEPLTLDLADLLRPL